MDTMLYLLIAMIPALAFVLYYALHRVKCPDCGDTLQFMFYSRSRRLVACRGRCYLCPRCGCETNVAGQKVTADTPPAFHPYSSLGLAGRLPLGWSRARGDLDRRRCGHTGPGGDCGPAGGCALNKHLPRPRSTNTRPNAAVVTRRVLGMGRSRGSHPESSRDRVRRRPGHPADDSTRRW